MNSFILNITASSGEFYQGSCESMVLPVKDGVYGVQAGHSPVLVAIHMGMLKFTVDGETRELLCGFVLGGPWGLAVGFAAPLLRSVLFGMPPMFPIAISMAFELAAYGAVSGWLYRRVKHTLPMTYATLAAAMVAGRLVWGAVRFVLAGLSGSSFPFSAFLSGALFTAVPGIIAQLVLIPLIITALQKAKVLE